MYTFKFADIGEGLHEGTVAEIYVKVGDSVNEGDSLFSVETDKVTSDIPSPVSGKVVEIRMAQGDVIHVGQDIFVFDDGSGDAPTPTASATSAPAAPAQSSGSGNYVFKFADIGEGLHEGTVAEIFVQVGQDVNEGDSLFSVETDKVTSDIPSPVTGKVKEIKMAKGDVIHVGQDIFVFDTPNGGNVVASEEKPAEEAASVVGKVEVSNDLIDFSSLGSAPSSTPAKEEVKPTEESKQELEDNETFEEGKAYNGPVDQEFDVIVIGSGPGGYLAAEEAGKAGFKTMIVEKKYWGGVCLNTGCIPTKAMLKSAEVLDYLQEAEKYGIVATKPKIDFKKSWAEMHARKAEVVKKLSGGVQFLMKSSKVTSVWGEAKFVGAREIEVEGKVYRAKNIILASGSYANNLSMIKGFEEGLEKGLILTSEEAINLDNVLPKSLVIIGGGVIGVEFATVFAASGVKVTILQNTDKLLPGTDPEIQKLIDKVLKEKGIEIWYNAKTLEYKASSKELLVEYNSKEETLKPDFVLVATGRTAYSLNAAEVGIKLGERGVVPVDSHQRTNVRGVYAIGDVTGQNMLAHVAYAHALTAVYWMLGDKVKGTYHGNAIPGCIYTEPEIAFTGMNEEQAKKAGKNYMVAKYSFSTLGKAIAAAKTEGFVKLIVDKEFGEILGAWMIGANVTDYIAEICLAMDQEITVHEIAHAIHPHPTFNEIIWEAARSASLKLTLEKMKK